MLELEEDWRQYRGPKGVTFLPFSWTEQAADIQSMQCTGEGLERQKCATGVAVFIRQDRVTLSKSPDRVP